MTAERVYADGKVFSLTGEELKQNGAWEQELTWLLTLAAVCNGAVLQEEGKGTTVIGDPTDGALLMAAAKAGLARGRLLQRYQLLKEHPFESRRKMMSVVVRMWRQMWSILLSRVRQRFSCPAVHRSGDSGLEVGKFADSGQKGLQAVGSGLERMQIRAGKSATS